MYQKTQIWENYISMLFYILYQYEYMYKKNNMKYDIFDISTVGSI